jgi:hypothetical protein
MNGRSMKKVVTLVHALIYTILLVLTYIVAVGHGLGCSETCVDSKAATRRHLHRGRRRHVGMKVLIYITTHLSNAHVHYLKMCWPSMIANSQILRRSDFNMFVTTSNVERVNAHLIESLFSAVNFKLHVRKNPGYQEGAMLAMTEAYEHGWFKHYDWVIRLNPDVFIKNETFLLQRLHEPDISGVFVDCAQKVCERGRKCPGRIIHTDFMAFRPHAIEHTAFRNVNESNAERQATKALQRIIEAGTDSWLTDVDAFRGICRVRGKNSPVVHEHNESRVYPSCLHWNS